MKTNRVAAALAVAVALALAACGGGGEAQNAAGLKAAVTEDWKALKDGDVATSYGRLSEACQKKFSKAKWGVQLKFALTMAEGFGLEVGKAKLEKVETKDIAGGKGQARTFVTIDGEPFDSEEPSWDEWLYQDGSWRTTECSSLMDDDEDEKEEESTSTTVGGDLRPADEASADEALEGAKKVSFGTPFETEPGMTVTVTNPVVGGDEDGPWLGVQVRAENRSGEGISAPSVRIRCAGSTESGSTLSDDGTYEDGADVPSGSFSEGPASLTLPGDGRYEETWTPCATPAVIWIEPYFNMSDEGTAYIPLSDSVVAELNAKIPQ